jgi:hypothetical protein
LLLEASPETFGYTLVCDGTDEITTSSGSDAYEVLSENER